MVISHLDSSQHKIAIVEGIGLNGTPSLLVFGYPNRSYQIRNGWRKKSTLDPFDKVLFEFCLNGCGIVVYIDWTEPTKFGGVS